MELTKDGILTELNNMKSALETSLTEKASSSIKNVDEKIDALNAQIDELKNKKSEVSADELATIKSDMAAVIKGFDLLQTRQTPKSSSTATTSLKSAIAEAMAENKASISSVSKDKAAKMTIKDVGDITTSNVDGAIPNTYRPGIIPMPYEMVHGRSLYGVTPSETDSYHFYRHSAGEGAVAFQTSENDSKAQLDADLVEEVVNLNYLAGFIRVSRKMLKNFSALRAHVSRWLPEEYYKAEDTAIANALGSATGVPDTSGTTLIDRIVLTIGAQKTANYNVNQIIVNGNTWAELLLNKSANSEEYTMPGGSVVITSTGQILICGIPVYTAGWVGDSVLVGDSRFFEIVQSEGLSLGFFDQDADNVTKNKVTARIEASVGFALLDPAAFAWVAKP